ncbi:tRNA(Ile)-lysidine synthase [Pirellulimonas nuda]|uniref:tRNA(Ile)-lysidine synthase n=1 Tax=Pirellulimonas nuda TaxID=2528009 RepID=A0A518D785_9BACT|nr:tRNA lysidine(34) synthetase TilS [Pirellulimonas nuda]QDU87337.1 tRNA(Ile)-lysidine synthase [Pirellulimonas nuda]
MPPNPQRSSPPEGELHPLEQAVALALQGSDWRAVNVVIAVSGGADSVALLRAICRLRPLGPGDGGLIAAHYNHRLRGDEAEADARWTAETCGRLGVPCELGAAATAPASADEAAARVARHRFLLQAAHKHGARLIAAGHTRDDQAETVLHRALRGAGVAGLAGIPARRELAPGVSLVRPLLSVSRQEVESYLALLEQLYRTDATNAQPCYTRNRLRHEALPLLRSIVGPGVDGALLRLAQHASNQHAVLSDAASAWRRLAASRVGQQWRIDRRQLAGLPEPVLCEVCRQCWRAAGWPQQGMTEAHWRRLTAALTADDCEAFDLPGAINVRLVDGALVLAPTK